MKRLTILVCLSLVTLLAGTTLAAGSGRDLSGYNVADGRYSQILTGQPIGVTKVGEDTLYMMGGKPIGPPWSAKAPGWLPGDFQSGAGGVLPDRQGWIGVDLTIKNLAKWNISTWNGRAILDPGFSPNHVMWCGELFAQGCPGGDPPEGYANGYDEWLDWFGMVANNAVSTDVNVQAVLNDDSEPGYDFLRFEVSRATGQDELAAWTGLNTLVAMDQSFTVDVADYVGPGLNQIHLRFHGTSDSGWSDGDCRWPTYGLAEVDNIVVTTNNGVNTTDNFEATKTLPPNWNVAFPPAAGEFSHVWPQLTDLDPCNSDPTPLFGWIDDGNVCPGTGGSPGITWTYGPGGYIFNTNGGLAGPGYHVQNEIWSPVLAWPGAQYTGMQYNFIAYRHLPLVNGVFYVWHVRDSTDGGTTWGGWADDNFVYYGTAADFLNIGNVVTAKLRSNRTNVQLAFGAWDYGWVWGYINHDNTPAPYFDNVRALAYLFPGPAMSARDIDTFQASNFPQIGTIDYGNLGNNSVRLDMANNISPRTHLRNDPGDSIIVSVAVVRTGATLNGRPRLYYKLNPNPLFNAYRTSGLPLQGSVEMDTTKTSVGALIANSWRKDLPDSNFFFPGDIMHWYVEAQDNQGGNIGTTRMPADTSGFAAFPDNPTPGTYRPLLYPSMFIARALPAMKSATPGDQPHILFWNDFADRGGENEWNGSLANLGYQEGKDFDEYYTNGPSSGVGNGLGGRATGPQLAGYSVMLYTSGDLGSYTLSNGDFKSDPGNDLAVMTDWLSQGGKKWFCTGDDLAYDMTQAGPAAMTFFNTFLPMTFVNTDIRPLIQNQINPVVNPVAGNAVGLTNSYIAYGGCQIFNKFDAVQATTGSVMIERFQQLSGAAYPYAAALYMANAGGYGDDIVYMPYDFMYIYKVPNTAKAPATTETRALVLHQILTFFGQAPSGTATGVGETPGLAFSAKNYPNPFNPSTKIEYTLTRPGQVSIKIYNVRGELVRTLLDGQVDKTAGSVTWLGDNDRGQKVSSGVYFYQVKSADNEVFNKMTLVK